MAFLYYQGWTRSETFNQKPLLLVIVMFVKQHKRQPRSLAFLAVDDAREAVARAIEAMRQDPELLARDEDLGLHMRVVVLVPVGKKGRVKPVLLYKHSEGDPETWRLDFKSICKEKIGKALRAIFCPVYSLSPYVLALGDTHFSGWYYDNNILVACSGLTLEGDMHYSRMVQRNLQEIALERWKISKAFLERVPLLTPENVLPAQ